MTDFKTALLNKIQTRELQVAVMGLGYVGLPLRLRSGQALAVELAQAGFQTTGLDLDPRKIEALR